MRILRNSALLLVLSLNLGAEEFIISYKARVKNNVLLGEQYNVSKSLTSTQNYNIIGECDLIESESSVFIALKRNKEFVLDCFQKYVNVNLKDYSRSINNALDSDTRVEIAPQRILTDDKNGAINIKIIKKIP